MPDGVTFFGDNLSSKQAIDWVTSSGVLANGVEWTRRQRLRPCPIRGVPLVQRVLPRVQIGENCWIYRDQQLIEDMVAAGASRAQAEAWEAEMQVPFGESPPVPVRRVPRTPETARRWDAARAAEIAFDLHEFEEPAEWGPDVSSLLGLRESPYDAAVEAERFGKIKRAVWEWYESEPLDGTLGERYLLEIRKIPKPEGGWPDAIRFHRPSNSLIGKATQTNGVVTAGQQVRLRSDGTNAVKLDDKGKLKKIKLTYGVLKGSAVRLAGPADGPLLLAEGPETGLSVQATGHETWIALGGIPLLDPPMGRLVVVCADDDQQAAALAKKLAVWRERGVRLAVAMPWPTRRGDGSDFNDVLRENGLDAVRSRIEAAILAASELSDPPSLADPAGTPSPYYPAPTEDRARALAWQDREIHNTLAEAARNAAARRDWRTHRDLAIAEAGAVSRAEKARITRTTYRQAAELWGYGRSIPPAPRALITGSQGTGKTTVAIRAVAAIPYNITVWHTVPSLEKAEEIAADYERDRTDASLPAIVLRGRGAPDPANPGKTMCVRSKAANKLAAADLSVPDLMCPSCPFHGSCSYLKLRQRIHGMGGRGYFIGSNAYLLTPSPAPTPDIVIADENLAMGAISVSTVPLASISPDLVGDTASGQEDFLAARGTILKVTDALQQPQALAALQEAGITGKDLSTVIKLLDAAARPNAAEINGRLSDERIIEIVDAGDDRLPGALAVLHAIKRELDGRPEGAQFNGIVYDPNRQVLTVSRLKRPRGIKTAAVLGLDGTGDIRMWRALFGEHLAHHLVRVERDAFVIGTRGKSYSRQSITGLDRNGEPMANREVSSARLRSGIAAIVDRQPGRKLVVATGATFIASQHFRLPWLETCDFVTDDR
jgi:hypothetical protein